MMVVTVESESIRSLVMVFFFPVIEFRVAVEHRISRVHCSSRIALRTNGSAGACGCALAFISC